MDDEPEILNIVEQTIPENIETRESLSKEYRNIMRMLYPKLSSQFYCVPPVHFNNVSRQPYARAQKKPRSKTQGKPTPAVHVQSESKLETVKADDVQQRTLCALTALTAGFTGPGFILSNLKFLDYLNYTPYKKASQAVAGLPRPSDLDARGKPKSKDKTTKSGQNKVEGDWDVLMFQPDGLGIVLLEIKSVGEGADTNVAAEYNPLQMAEERVKQGLNQLEKGSSVISHIVSDRQPRVKVLRGLVLPNVRRDSLHQILKTLSPADLNKLGVDVVEDGLDCCLCKEDLPARGENGDVPEAILNRLRKWWSNMKRQLSAVDQVIDKHTYEHIVARFCGPLTTVRLYDPNKKLREVRTLRQATSLSADHFAAIVLTQQQVEVLDDLTLQHVHIMGAPGTGKSVLLQCKAVNWLQLKQPVIVVVGSVESAYISHHIYNALSKKGKLVSLFTACDKGASFDKHVEDVYSRHPYKQVLVIFDEFEARNMGRVFCNNHLNPNKLCVWSASAWVGECPRHEDEAYKLVQLDRVMRSPPRVQNLLRILQPTVRLRGTPCEIPVDPPCPPDLHPPPTYGLEVKLLSHAKHQATDIWDCKDCGKQLAHFLQRDLHLGLPPEMRKQCGRGESTLEHRDVLVLSAKLGWEAVNTKHEKPFVRALKKEATSINSEIQVEFANPTRSIKTHKFPRENKVVFARCDSVRGWESKVVVFVPHRGAMGTSDCIDLGAVVNGAGPHDDEASKSNSPVESEDSAAAHTDSEQVEIAAVSEDVKKAVATLSHASQEDAYTAISGTIALAVLFHF